MKEEGKYVEGKKETKAMEIKGNKNKKERKVTKKMERNTNHELNKGKGDYGLKRGKDRLVGEKKKGGI